MIDNGKVVRSIKRGIEYGSARTPLLKRLYWKCAPLYYRWKLIRQMNHDAPLDPLKIAYVEPNLVCKMSGRENRINDRYKDIGKIQDGDWDKRPPKNTGIHNNINSPFTADKIEDTILYKSYYNHFIKGVPWNQTDLFKQLNIIIQGGGSFYHIESKKDIEKKFLKIENLYDEIKSNGYKTQFQLHEKNIKKGRVGYLDVLTDEITVDIGRNGELLFVDGRHRLCIAKILGIDEIPIVFLVRHNQWMQQRKSLYMDHNHEQGSTHPDTVEFADGRSSSR